MTVVCDVVIPDSVCKRIASRLKCRVIKAAEGEADATVFRETRGIASLYISMDYDWLILAGECNIPFIFIEQNKCGNYFKGRGKELISKIKALLCKEFK